MKALEELKANLSTKKGIRWIDLDVQCAYHSHFTKEPGMKLAEEIKTLQPSSNTIPVFSSVTGREITTADHYCKPYFWTSNVAGKVKFFQALLESRNQYADSIYLEIGPSPVLLSHATSIFKEGNVQVIPSMKKKSGIQQFLEATSKLYVLGINMKWKGLFQREPPLADIPKYCFNCKPLFEESVVRKMKRSANSNTTSQTVLMEKSSDGNFRCILSEQTTPFIFEHIVEESIIVPGAFYGAIGIEVGKEILGLKDNITVEWTIESPLAISLKQSSEIAIDYQREKEDTDKHETAVTYRIYDANKQVLSNGSISKLPCQSVPDILDMQEHKDRLNKKQKDEFIYKTLRRFGFNHGPLYRIIQKGIYSKEFCFAEVNLNESQLSLIEGGTMHTIVIDGMLQSCCAFLPFFPIPTDAKLFPVGIGKLQTKQKVSQKMYIYSRVVQNSSSNFVCNSILLQENGIVVAEMLNIELRIIGNFLSGNELSLQYKWQKLMLDGDTKTSFPRNTTILYRRRNAPSVSLFDRTIDKMCIDSSNLKVIGDGILSKGSNVMAYLPGSIYGEMGIQEIYDEIVEDGKTFLKLVHTFLHLDVKIVVITEATQNLNERQLNVNLLGSELWGMVRSIAREPTKLSFYLIDTHPNVQQNIETLGNLLCRISEDDSDIPFETCIVNGEIRYGYVQQMFKKRDAYPAKELEFLARKSMPTRKVVNQSQNSEQNMSTTISVSVACRNIMDVFENHNSTVLVNIGEIWASGREKSTGKTVLEFTGTTLDKNRRQREVICCYPCTSVAEIAVPKQFLLFRNEVSNYSPGMLQSCILALTITEYLNDTKTVVAMADENFQWTMQILKQILKKRRTSLTSSSDMVNINSSELKKASLLVLSSRRRCRSDIIESNLFSKVIFFDNSLKANFKGNFIYVSPDQIFSLQNISRKMKNVKKVLKKLDRPSAMMQTCDVTRSKELTNSVPQNYINHGKVLVKERSSYVVVGGFSGLGWLLVKELARCGAVKILIFSRRKPNEEMTRKLQGLINLHNVQIIPVQVDICNQKDLSRVFRDLESVCKNEPIRGIFQGAAVTADKLASEMSWDQYEIPLRPKVLGTLNLDQASRNLTLDYFVIHSSIAALLGNIGQSNYAAGNSFQDCFALFRRSLGLPATSIVWTALDVGLAADAITKDSLRSQGLISLTQQQILECTHHAIFFDEVHSIFAHIDWKVFLQNFIKSLKFKFKDFRNESKHATYRIQQIDERRPSSNNDASIQMVLDCLASVFTLDQSQISLSTPIVEYGLDSQKGTELASLIFEKSNVRVPYIYLATDDHTASDISHFVKSKQEIQISHEKSKEDKDRKKSYRNFVEELLLADDNVSYNIVHLVVADTTIDLGNIHRSLHILLYLHPVLRTIFHIDTDSEGRKFMKKEIRETEDAICQIRVSDEQSFYESMETKSVEKEVFKINVFHGKEQMEILFMFCPLVFDACSIAKISEELSRILLYININFCHNPESSAIEEECHRPSFEDFFAFDEEKMNVFWNSELKRQKDPLLALVDESSNALRWSSSRIPDHTVSILQQSLSVNGISMYQFMVCFSQLGLAMVTKTSDVTVLAQSDVRPFIGFDESTIGMYSDIVPLITDLIQYKDVSLQDFITRNIQKVTSVLDEGRFPFQLIQNLEEFQNTKHQSLLCSYIDENNGTGFGKTIQVKGYRPGFTSLARLELLIVSCRHHLTLYVNTSETLFNRGVALLDSMNQLMDLYVHHADIRLEELIFAHPTEKIIGTTNGTLFLKKSKTTSLAVQPKIHPKKKGGYLQLGDIDLSLSDILAVSVCDEDQRKLSIRTKKKTVILHAENTKTIESWVSFIKSKLDGQNNGWKLNSSQSCLFQPALEETI